MSDSGGVGLHAGESAGGVGRVRRGSEGALFTSSSKEILKNKAIGKALEEYYRVSWLQWLIVLKSWDGAIECVLIELVCVEWTLECCGFLPYPYCL